ncbi:unnamed protein product [Lampetra planeri]
MAASPSSLRRGARGGGERGGRGEGRGRRGSGGRGGRRGVEGRRGEVGGRASKAELSFVEAPSRLLAAAPSGPRRLGRTAPPPGPGRAPHGRIGSPPSWVTSQFPGGLGDRPLGGTGQCGSRIPHRRAPAAVATGRAIPSGRFLPLQFLVCSSSSNNSGSSSNNNSGIHRLPGARNSKAASVVRAAVGCEASETSTPETSPPSVTGLETGASQSGHRNHGERESGARDTRADDSGLRLLLDLSAPSVLTPDCSHHLPADNPAAIDVGRSPSGATQRWGGRGEGKTVRGTTLPLRRLLLLDDPEDDSSPSTGGPVLAEDTPEEMRVRAEPELSLSQTLTQSCLVD